MIERRQVDLPTLDEFSAHLGETFRVQLDAHGFVLELIQANRSRAADAESDEFGRQPFSLLFFDPQGSVHSFFPQGTYRLEHAALGARELFIVPIGPDRDRGGMQYEAIFG